MKGKIILIVLLVVFVLIQLIPVNKPEAIAVNKNDLIANNQIPANVEKILKTSCYDCHSNQTVYPWYAFVAPISWQVVNDINEGKKDLNFSDWELYSKMDKAQHLGDIGDVISDKSMPYWMYPIMHPEARLSEEQRQEVIKWTQDYGNQLFQ